MALSAVIVLSVVVCVGKAARNRWLAGKWAWEAAESSNPLGPVDPAAAARYGERLAPPLKPSKPIRGKVTIDLSEYWDGVLTKTADTVSTAYTLDLCVTNLNQSTGVPEASVTAEFCGAQIGIAYAGYLDKLDYGTWPERLQAAWDEWAALVQQYNEEHPEETPLSDAYCTYWSATAQVGGTSDTDYLVTGWADTIVGPPDPPVWVGPTEWKLSGSFGISNLVNTVRCGADWKQGRLDPTKDRLPIRSWHDRYAQYILCATDQTQVTAAIGICEVTFDYDFPAPEGITVEAPIGMTPVIIGGESSQLTLSFSCNDLHSLDTDYCYVDNVKWGGEPLDLTRVSFWSDDGSEWTASASQPSGTHLHIFGSGTKITMHRVGTGTSEAAGAIEAQALGPIRYNLHAAAFAPDSEVAVPEEEEEWSAFTGLYVYEDEETMVPVYLGQGLSDYYMQLWWYVSGDVNNRIKTGEYYFDFDFQGCRVKDSYLNAHYEYFDNDDNQDNHHGMVVLPSIESSVSTDDPYWAGAIEITHSNISVDIPPGETERPSEWVGDGVTVDNETNQWVVGASGGTVTRELKSRYFVRMDYIAAKVPEGGWWNADAPIWQKANAIEDADDLPAAVTACPVEDVTNYDNSSWLELSFSTWPTGAVGQTVTLTLDYRLVWVYDPCYTCAEHRYMSPDGEWEYGYSEASTSFSGDLQSDGTVRFDLGELERSNTVNLQHVTNVTFTFPAGAAGTYVLDDVRLVDDDDVTDDPVLVFQAAIAPWAFLTDFTGAGGTASGVACLNLAYGYEDKRGCQRGMAQTQYSQHCPESEAQGDISAPKALSRMVNELNWQEQISATYPTSAWQAAMTDDEGHTMGNGPYWWDLARGTGDGLDGRGGIAVRHLVAVPYGTGPVPVTVNCYWTCGGRVHGLAYNSGERNRLASGVIAVRRRLKTGGEWESMGTCDTDGYGRFQTLPIGENYYVACNGQYEVTTRQYSISGLSVDLWDPYTVLDRAGISWRAAESGGAVYVHFAGAGRDYWTPVASRPWADDMARPSIAVCDDGSLLVAATNSSGSMEIKRSRNWGQTWEAV